MSRYCSTWRLTNKHINHPAMGPYQLLEFEPLDAGGFESAKADFLMAVTRGEWNKSDHLFQWMWKNAPAIEVFDLLMSVAIPKNFHDDHYFMYPGTMWRAFETGVLDKAYLPVLMRPVVRFVTRNPVAPNNPMPSPMPAIEALIEEHQLLGRILRQRSGEDETAAIGELGEALGHVDVFADIPKLMAKALAEGLSLEGGGEALSIGAAGLFLRSLGGNPMDVHLHTSVNLRRWLLRLDGLSIRNKVLLLLTWQSGPEIRSTAMRMEPAPRPDMAAVAKLPPRAQDELLDAIAYSIYHQPPTDWSTVTNLGPDARGAGGRGDDEPRHAICEERLRPEGFHCAAGRDRVSRQFHRDARFQASPGDRRGILRDARAVALDASGVRRPGRGGLLRQEHGGLRGVSGAPPRRIARLEKPGGTARLPVSLIVLRAQASLRRGSVAGTPARGHDLVVVTGG